MKLRAVFCALLLAGCAPAAQATDAAPTSTPIMDRSPSGLRPQFYFGVDLSYANEMLDCGAVFLEGGEPQDPYELLAAHGANLVRARLWHSPDWTQYSTLADVLKTFERARDLGQYTLLDFHYSDNWADPGRQEIPAAWQAIEDTGELAEAVYQYTYDTLMQLHAQGLMPDFVQVGNETNSGLLKKVVRLDWPRDVSLFEAGIRAVRDAASAAGTHTQVLLHVAQPENTSWWFREAAEHGLTDFDIIGVSYYPQWSSFSISGLAYQVSELRRTYGKDVMILETGYPWTTETAGDTANNVLTAGQRGYTLTPQGQLDFMRDLTRALMQSGALGVVYWEPAWVSTSCVTRWGQGSHWENAAFFDFQHENEVLPVVAYMQEEYAKLSLTADGAAGPEDEALAEDVTGDSLNGLAHLDLLSLHTRQDETSLSLVLGLAGDALANPGSNYRFYFDTTADEHGANVDPGKRPIDVADPYRPEFILEIQTIEAAGTRVAEGNWFTWDGAAWRESAFAGGLAVGPDAIEVVLAREWLGNPATLHLAAISAGRVLTRGASDILGADGTPANAEETTILRSFLTLELSN